NVSCYVLNEKMQPVPMGVDGHLYIGGDCLARGYVNQPDLTADRFVLNPYSDAPNARLYQTGDLVRWLPDGNLEFLGRIDHQVKIRGFRVELGEIESVLATQDYVKDVVVLAKESNINSEEKRLVAYVVTTATD